MAKKTNLDDIAVEIKDLNYSYRKSTQLALSGINLSVNKGEFIGILGPTGAGKTTLCMCLNGLIPHSLGGDFKGKVVINGIDTEDSYMSDLSKHVGITFQDPESQIFGNSVEEDLAFGPENLGIEPKIIRERIDTTLETIRMNQYRLTIPWKLSGGQKQRVAIGAALTMLPNILVFDEPLSELDPIGKSEVMEVIAQLNKTDGYTVFLVEHNTELLNECADRIIVLNNGSIILDGSPKDVFKNAKLLKEIKVSLPQVTMFQLNWLKKPSVEEQVITFEEELVQVVSKDGFELKKDISEKREDNSLDKNNDREVVISIDTLCQDYGESDKILNCIDLEIYNDDFISIIGQNGSGKTTLVKHFNGLLKPTDGRITVFGMDTKKHSVAEISNRVGYVFQNPDHQIFSSSVMDEILFGLNLRDYSDSEKQDRIYEALVTVDLWDQKDIDPLSLGKGGRQKLALASVLAIKPDILIIDEPTTGMDYSGCVNIMDLINQLHDSGMTIIVITHDMWVVTNYSKRVIVMGEGGILIDDKPEIVFKETDILTKAFIKPPSITQLGKKLGLKKIILSEEDLALSISSM